jgi:hypothetical protein
VCPRCGADYSPQVEQCAVCREPEELCRYAISHVALYLAEPLADGSIRFHSPNSLNPAARLRLARSSN